MDRSYSSSIRTLLERWQQDPAIAANIVYWHKNEMSSGDLSDLPADLHPRLRQVLHRQGLERLYSHQEQCWQYIKSGKHVAVVTGTASGKTLCYSLPVLDTLLRNPEATAIYLFPTKALAQDQKEKLSDIMQGDEPGGRSFIKIPFAVYDGDTPGSVRSEIRSKARLLLTNPDMLHVAILPHHTRWENFFRHLRYVVIDEMHIYRGVFGSHVANLIRRLKRLAAFYGANPQFILTSATIANPGQLARSLIEAPVQTVDTDGSPHGQRHFLLYNPPVVHQELGLRRSALAESARLAGDLLTYGVQIILFTRSRRSVELLLRDLQTQNLEIADRLHGYRSGYLPKERRAIEKSLRSGETRAVAATNALELGVDIGSVGCVILAGYPGTIAATRQQAGRGGRKQGVSLAVLVASAGPLDQFLVKHPGYIFEKSPEQALINPDNLLILLQHLRCAAFELPFSLGEGFGTLDKETLATLLSLLQREGVLHYSQDRYFWAADQYPADKASLRTASGRSILLQENHQDRLVTIGEVDLASAYWMVHPGAIYLHESRSYEVIDLDVENGFAQLSPTQVDNYTEPRSEVNIKLVSSQEQAEIAGGMKAVGEIMVSSQVIGYRKMQWFTNEVLDQIPLSLPATELRTVAYWISLSQRTVDMLRERGFWQNDPNAYGANWPAQRELAKKRDGFRCRLCGADEARQPLHVHHITPFRTFPSFIQANQLENLVTLCPSCHHKTETSVRMRSGLSGLRYVIHHLAPLFLMCDIGDLGAHSDPESPLAEGRPTVVVYDQVPAGIGLSESLFRSHQELIQNCYDLVLSCSCLDGCPGCVGPAGENGIGGKQETLAILSQLCGQALPGEGYGIA